jgi:hypothetical protein
MRDGAIVACLVLAVAHAFGVLSTGVDAHAYWAADPFDPYGVTQPAVQDAYFYTPAFAQLLGPLHLLPWPWFITLWTLLLTAALVWQAGLWTGFVLLLVPVFAELTLGNVHFLLGVAIVAGFRWPWLWSLPILTKVTPGVGLLWFALRREWRSLAIALGTTAAISTISFVIAPGLWFDWIRVLGAATKAHDPAVFIAIPFWLRAIAALALVSWGALTDRRWTVPVASMLALPILWVNSLAMLVAVIPLVPRLVGETPASRWLARRAVPAAEAAQTVPA